MAKDFKKLCEEHVQRRGGRIKAPDPDVQPLSYWTYADMKREYELSVEIFRGKGYSDEECGNTAERCITMDIHWRNFDGYLTERIMARTINLIYMIEHGLFVNTKSNKRVYDRLVKRFREKPAKGFKLSESEKAELERDIDIVFEKFDSAPVEESKTDLPFSTNALNGIEFVDLGIYNKVFKELYTEKDPAPDFRIQKMRELLSPSAFELITEYDFGKLDIELYEQYVLKPLELKMTEPLRRFLELYDGTVFAYQTHAFGIDYKYSHDNFRGFRIEAIDYIAVGNDGKYYINTMRYHYAGDWGPFVGSNGKIYGFAMGCLYPTADSMEELLEEHARKKAPEEAFVARRIELDNKYLIPEVRVSSM